MFETIKAYASAIKLAILISIIAAIAFSWWYHGHQNYLEGKAEVQALWDADKAQRKADANKQAAETAQLNQEKNDALKHTQNDLRSTRNNLDTALERLRDLPSVPGGTGMLMAGSGGAAVPGMAENTGRVSITIEKRIGRCADSGSDPCYMDRQFFEQAIADATDRRLTREWAAGQGIITIPPLPQ